MRRILVSAVALALAAGSVSVEAQQAPAIAQAQAATQLPRNVRPTHYDVAVVPHAQSLSFDG